MTVLFILSQRESPATLKRELISTTCRHDFILLVTTQRLMTIGEVGDID